MKAISGFRKTLAQVFIDSDRVYDKTAEGKYVFNRKATFEKNSQKALQFEDKLTVKGVATSIAGAGLQGASAAITAGVGAIWLDNSFSLGAKFGFVGSLILSGFGAMFSVAGGLKNAVDTSYHASRLAKEGVANLSA